MGLDANTDDTPTDAAGNPALGAKQAEFSAHYERLAPAAATWVRLRLSGAVKDRCPPEDFLQELWFRAFRAYPTFDPARGEFRTWLFAIAQNLLIEILRSMARRAGPAREAFPFSEVPDDATAVSRRACKDEAVRSFAAAVGSLDDEERELLLWRGLEGLSHDEIATRLKTSRDAVMKRWQRLRDRIEPWLPAAELIAS